METENPDLGKIQTFVDAGTESLSEHTFVSEELNKKKDDRPELMRARGGGNPNPGQEGGDSEESVRYRMNQTGNIFYSTTSPLIQEETKELFNSVSVLFAAMTRAMKDQGYDLFDYAEWSKLIRGTGYFVEVTKLYKTITISSSYLTIDTQIVQDLLPGLKQGSSMDIAKSVLRGIGGKFELNTSTAKTEFGHLLFICEELFGAASITVRLFKASKDSHKKVTKSGCHESSTTTYTQEQEADTFLFVSPATIAKFASTFGDRPEAFDNLIEDLKKSIPKKVS